jgi:hypothetical protein
VFDLLIAHVHDAWLYTRNAVDLMGLADLVEVDSI